MKSLSLQNTVVAVILISAILLICEVDSREKEDADEEKPKDVCSKYSAITKVVIYFSNHLASIIDGRNNLFFSPLAISISLAMIYLGAGGETAKDMEISLGYKKLNLNNPSEDIHKVFHNSLKSLSFTSQAYRLEVASGIFMQNGFEVSPSYLENLKRLYFTEVHPVDFKLEGGRAVSKINKWASNHTSNKITTLFDDPLDPLTRLILANAVYFKGIWKHQFNPNLTMRKNFYSTQSAIKRVPFMDTKSIVPYFRDDVTNYTFIELDYKGGEMSMIIALPYDRRELPKLELTTSLMCRVRKNFKPTKMHIMIPKFSLMYERELSKDLFHLGMGDLFNERRANLTGIRSQNDLFVSAMVHKAKIDVNEEGSEAFAANGVVVNSRSGQNQLNVFNANHPFLFGIVDKRSGTLLFLGRVVDL